MKTFLSLLILLSGYAQAEKCEYKIDGKKAKIHWEAYKTLAKAGVKGSFDEIVFQNIKSHKKKSDTFNNIRFTINTHTVNSGDKSRDRKLKEHFFTANKRPVQMIGDSQKYSKKKINVKFNINGVQKEVPLSVDVQKASIKAEGYIDMLDFGLHQSLVAINKACSLLHNGKTWSDVKVWIEADLLKVCK